MLRAVLFDVDGVLVDSLQAHLRICHDKIHEFGLALATPTPGDIRELLRRRVRISPMIELFRAVGLHEPWATRALADYERDFAEHYRPAPFAGTAELLRALAAEGMPLGLVTANTLKNVRSMLGGLIEHFDPALVYDHQTSGALGKSEALRAAATHLPAAPSELVYIGDQRADFEAAGSAGTRFIGVTYGWGLDERDQDLTLATTPAEVLSRVREL